MFLLVVLHFLVSATIKFRWSSLDTCHWRKESVGLAILHWTNVNTNSNPWLFFSSCKSCRHRFWWTVSRYLSSLVKFPFPIWKKKWLEITHFLPLSPFVLAAYISHIMFCFLLLYLTQVKEVTTNNTSFSSVFFCFFLNNNNKKTPTNKQKTPKEEKKTQPHPIYLGFV